MQAIPCPSCGAEIVLRSPALPYAVCRYCQTMVARQGDEHRDIGKAAVLPFDISPVQIGTTGRMADVAFEVMGRVRWGWENGFWNEWLLMGIDGHYRWLGEAMGQFMLQRELDIGKVQSPHLGSWQSGGNVQLGQQMVIDDIQYTASDIKSAHCLGAEGQLPFRAPADWSIISADFRSEAGGSASVQRDEDGVTIYAGKYIELTQLNPQNLRQISGWKIPIALKGN
jgi:Domain of unknown function (DUF4178)